MRRAALVILAALTISGKAVAADAPASCGDEVRAAQSRLPQVKNVSHRRELQLLLDKAGMDAAAGRERLCLDALVRAEALER
jgi:hypothetical protein